MNNKFLGLIEYFRYKKYLNKAKCNFCKCNYSSIKSHSYPKSFLKKISKNKEIFCIDIRKAIASILDNDFEDFITKSSVKESGVLPLFCNEHDTKVFSRIENLNKNIDIETYLFLYSYRFFIYDYFIDKYVRKSIDSKHELDRDLVTQVTPDDLESYIQRMNLTTELFNKDYDKERLAEVKDKFDNIFSNSLEPSYKDFKELFTIKYYNLRITDDFFASGIMYYKLDKFEDIKEPMVSIFSLIPNNLDDTFYFTIVIPNEELDNISPLVNFLDNEYKKYLQKDENCFLDCVVFNLLDASQNIFMTKDCYSRVDIKELRYIYTLLVFARIDRLNSRMYKDLAFNKIKKLGLILERQ
ncbi:hypothetical protein ACV3RB_13405 [Clostridium perfringens]